MVLLTPQLPDTLAEELLGSCTQLLEVSLERNYHVAALHDRNMYSFQVSNGHELGVTVPIVSSRSRERYAVLPRSDACAL